MLGLENPGEYTGHTLRRTAATIMADKGASGQTLRHKLNQRSEKAVNEYLSSSKAVQKSNALMLSGFEEDTSNNSIAPLLQHSNDSIAPLSHQSNSTATVGKFLTLKIFFNEAIYSWSDFYIIGSGTSTMNKTFVEPAKQNETKEKSSVSDPMKEALSLFNRFGGVSFTGCTVFGTVRFDESK